MKSFSIASAALAAIALLATPAVADVDPIVIKGSKFFYKTNGTQFFIKGVAYQQEYAGSSGSSGTGNSGSGGSGNDNYKDPLADLSAVKRDIPYLKQLQTNTIRVYAVDPKVDHTQAMNALADAGIYVLADLSSPGQSINRNDPAWNDDLYARYTSVVDNLAKFTNTLGFLAGNEVSNAPNNTDASAFVKAAVRDIKTYIKAKNYRTIGVGYATNDDADIRENMANYFNCGDSASTIDFWGYNIYSWCGQSSYSKSGYDVRTKEFSTYSVPAFFAEYGCNEVSPRPFTEVQALYGSQMAPVWSGGIVYMYFQEANKYGLVSVSGNSVTPNQDFKNLASQIAKASPSGVKMSDYKPTNSPASCPATGKSWTPKASPLPPSPNKALCSCMYQSLGCTVADNANEDNYGKLFGQVCGYGQGVCAGISANATTGSYGAYGMCSAKEKLAFAFNQYYNSQKKVASACDFGGSAKTQAARSPGGSCSSLMNQAGTAGTGVVTSSPTATGGGSGSSGSGSSGGSGMLPMVLAIGMAVVSGIGMVLL
ncbi:carbohydrate-binding module family 43 protein [Piedraia hortae CBS 480.64]|uniref:1,3-beta-glucanosyltransferase n=1 Tax=Piedraia hortae CBS 480.64 TaxID=1314780 RepID=A0A6A7C426_9PEZI|nr:carbohydrate-binding module family 43 protein [Piedraia hortae CBS 480.64]